MICPDLYFNTRKEWRLFMLFYPPSQGKINSYQLIAILDNFKGQVLLLQKRNFLKNARE